MNSIIVKEVANFLEEYAPRTLAESYDNVGLIVGESEAKVKGILVCLDVTEEVIEEAIGKGCNLIVAHHPIWFTPRKQLHRRGYVARCLLKAIENNIFLYAIHTNLDNVLENGVSERMARMLGLQNVKILQPEKGQWLCLHIYHSNAQLVEELKNLFCARNWVQLLESSENKSIWQVHKHRISQFQQLLSSYREKIIAVVQNGELQDGLLSGLSGTGVIGELPLALTIKDFLDLLKNTFQCGALRYAKAAIEKVQRVALCGGAGSFLIEVALSSQADAFVTGDITYHKFFDNEQRMLLVDIGHYESEQYTIDILFELLSDKFAPFIPIYKTSIRTNPIEYYF
ncbi:MAG: Nif3-like dinuclear metal center hexameric protein [Bacteroidia bacterium]|nr:Nif3-like dinuclear metal center hexameric protein [Bacteroidia bacterium]MDW8157982.1 Nif3-like dinuclear metal center hexameric protein [Bacteroidia bacterium]